jgi:hypothetical protein
LFNVVRAALFAYMFTTFAAPSTPSPSRETSIKPRSTVPFKLLQVWLFAVAVRLWTRARKEE